MAATWGDVGGRIRQDALLVQVSGLSLHSQPTNRGLVPHTFGEYHLVGMSNLPHSDILTLGRVREKTDATPVPYSGLSRCRQAVA
jgi:hypothetical protein